MGGIDALGSISLSCRVGECLKRCRCFSLCNQHKITDDFCFISRFGENVYEGRQIHHESVRIIAERYARAIIHCALYFSQAERMAKRAVGHRWHRRQLWPDFRGVKVLPDFWPAHPVAAVTATLEPWIGKVPAATKGRHFRKRDFFRFLFFTWSGRGWQMFLMNDILIGLLDLGLKNREWQQNAGNRCCWS